MHPHSTSGSAAASRRTLHFFFIGRPAPFRLLTAERDSPFGRFDILQTWPISYHKFHLFGSPADCPEEIFSSGPYRRGTLGREASSTRPKHTMLRPLSRGRNTSASALARFREKR